MQNIILDNIFLIMLLPLWIFLIIMCGRFFSVYVNKKIIYLLTLCASLFGAGVCLYSLNSLNQPVENVYKLIQIKDFVINFGLFADKISLGFGLLLFAISFAVQLFSTSYMDKEEKNYRFFALLNLFNFGMASLLFSPNLFQLYVFWEIIGIVSYLLIGFEYKKEEKSIASRRVFLVNRIGDTALIAGIILTSYFMYNYSGVPEFTSLPLCETENISSVLYAYTSTPAFLIICILFIIGAMVKSAQFPFHIWLQDAMEAKIPVSALLHSATMVTAGVYLIIRIMPFIIINTYIMKTLVITGLFTAILCAILASAEAHPKKILAYSTSANLGLMFFALGLGKVNIALILLAVHAIIKSTLFLTLPKEDKTISYITFTTFVIGALSLAGIFICGLPAKEILYSALGENIVLKICILISSFFTAFYITKLAFSIYKNSNFCKKINGTEVSAFMILLIYGFLIHFIFFGNEHKTLGLPLISAISGAIIASILYKFNLLEKFRPIPKFVEILSYKFLPEFYSGFSNFCRRIDEKIFENYKPIITFAKFGINFVSFIEEKIMNNFVKYTAQIAKWISQKYAIAQSGNVQTYNAYAFIIITIISVAIILLLIGYTLIMMSLGG